MNENLFDLFDYQLEIITANDLSSTEKILLIRLSLCFGRDGLICPTNRTLAMWLGKFEDLDEKKHKNAINSIKTILSNLRKKEYIKSFGQGKNRRIYLINQKTFENYTAYEEEEYLLSLSYDDFLKTKYWSYIKKIKKKDFNNRCSICYSNKELNVHHRTYKNHGREHEHLEDLIVLCKECHAKFHDKLNTI